MTDKLYMIRLTLDIRRIYQIAGHSLLSRHPLDIGYFVHCAIRELFDTSTFGPFAIMGSRGHWLNVLTYNICSHMTLMKCIREKIREDVRRAICWEKLDSKRMPSGFPEGARFGFRIRMCPVIRKSRGSRRFTAGAELDVFLAELDKVGGKTVPDRRKTYVEWFTNTMARSGGCYCENVRLTTMRRAQLVRRDSKRNYKIIDRPDVVFQGLLRIDDPVVFFDLLRSGMGRHRAFGFGMLLLH